MDTGIDRRIIAGLTGLVLLAVVGVAVVATGGGDDTMTFIKPALASEYLVQWPRETGQVTYPDQVEIVGAKSFSRPTQAMATGSAEVALVSLVGLPAVHGSNPDARAVYGVKTPNDLFTLYSNNGSVEDLADLRGKTVALSTSSTAGTLTLLALQDAGVNASEYTVINKPPTATLPLLSKGDADAALVMSMFPTGQYDRIVSPYSYWEDELDASIAPTFVVADGQEHVDVATTVARKQNTSYRVGRQNIDQVIEDNLEETGDNSSAAFHAFKDTRVIRMTAADIAAHQQLLDLAVEQGLVERTTDLAEHFVSPDGS